LWDGKTEEEMVALARAGILTQNGLTQKEVIDMLTDAESNEASASEVSCYLIR
jgi:hypothetical protein